MIYLGRGLGDLVYRDWRHGKSRNGVADAIGIGESRLRQMENAGTLPQWSDLDADDYFHVALLVVAGRKCGLSPVSIRRAVAAIRRADSYAALCEREEAALQAIQDNGRLMRSGMAPREAFDSFTNAELEAREEAHEERISAELEGR